MKIGICYLKETDKGLLLPIKHNIPEIGKKYSLCIFDFNTWEDLLDYCRFQNYDAFIFISDGKRITDISKLLNLHYGKNIFSVYSNKLDLVYGQPVILDDSLTYNDSNEYERQDEALYLKNGAISYVTGMYPNNIPKNIVKHIFLIDEKLLNKLPSDLFIKSDINTSIIMNVDTPINKEYPFIFLTDSYVNIDQYQSIEKIELINYIKTFIKHGSITSYTSPCVIDFGSLLEFNNLNRIFLSNSSIYSDFQMTDEIINVDELSLNSLRNSQSLKDSTRTIEISLSEATTFNLLATLGFYMKERNLNVVTPFNYGNLPPENIDHMRFLGLNGKNEDFLYDALTGRFFIVDSNFIIILEFYIKNQMESSKLKELGISEDISDKFLLTLENLTKI